MGYTHYYEVNHTLSFQQWRKISENAKKLINFSPVKLTCETGDPSAPEIKSTHIMFNGYNEDDGYETFLLNKDKSHSFCKTARHGYDIVVKAVLALAYTVGNGNISVESDGTAAEWNEAITWAKTVLDMQLTNPISDN